MSIVEAVEAGEIARLTEGRIIPAFSAGDTVRVNVKVVEGTRERVQAFEGVCIARRNAGVNSSFTVRKISYGEGVERVFPLYSPRLDSIEVVRRGRVRRARLYFLRGRAGRGAVPTPPWPCPTTTCRPATARCRSPTRPRASRSRRSSTTAGSSASS